MTKPFPALPGAGTIDAQRAAADPIVSAWVSANAGSGKTYVLSSRVIRILLAGTDPSKILCLTYTKAAASEMKTRVFDRLAAWVALDDDALRKGLSALQGGPVDDALIKRARTLFAHALETPGGLKIQTIHAFCQALLQRFPLEANIAGHFELIDDARRNLLIAQARRLVFADDGPGSAIQAVTRFLSKNGENALEGLLDSVVKDRIMLQQLLRETGDRDDRRAAYLEHFGFALDETRETIAAQAWPLPWFTKDNIERLDEFASAHGGKTLPKQIEKMRFAHDPSLSALTRLDNLASIFLTQKRQVTTKDQFPKGIDAKVPDYNEAYLQGAQIVVDTLDRLTLYDEVNDTLDALEVADGFISRYYALTSARGLLDYEDLIERTGNMLMRPGVGEWVRYKLDKGIDHLLIDEAQDTGPGQWHVIRQFADEFFSGDGQSREKRTVFAVGDEKQSIYSFQGADPRDFTKNRDHFRQQSKSIDAELQSMELRDSFRSTEAVLSAVDKVFNAMGDAHGLTEDPRQLQHFSLRKGAPGYVDVWPVEKKVKGDESEDWAAPIDAPIPPAQKVAMRIAATIADWLKRGEMLEGEGRPIKAGDILVLVRSRAQFVPAVTRALKDAGVPVAGADRLRLTEHIAIADLMALGRALLHEGDDLSLAAVLKSPLCNLDDEELFGLAHNRGAKTLWQRLREEAENHAQFSQVVHRLTKWKKLALSLPVFEFYAAVLADPHGRQNLTGRLGPETDDVLDEFMAHALGTEQTSNASLQAFLENLAAQSPEIKREMEQDDNAVRVMTVHGSKGLEAPIVFLIDRGGKFDKSKAPRWLVEKPLGMRNDNEVSALIWRPTGTVSKRVSTVFGALEQKYNDEHNRLLYVGMTRAADRLIVGGYQSGKIVDADSWLSKVHSALEAESKEMEDAHGPYIRYPADAAMARDGGGVEASSLSPGYAPLPDGFVNAAKSEPPPKRPLIPSGVSSFTIARTDDNSGSTASKSLLAVGNQQAVASPNEAMQRGIAIHSLLQILPDIDPAQRQMRARDWLAASFASWPEATHAHILKDVFAVLYAPEYSDLFSTDSRAEVQVIGRLMIGGEERGVSGVIDRLVVNGDQVKIVDYKTNARPAQNLAQVPPTYARQMALYRALMLNLYPGKQVRAFLLFTSGPRIIELPAAAMVAAMDDLANS